MGDKRGPEIESYDERYKSRDFYFVQYQFT